MRAMLICLFLLVATAVVAVETASDFTLTDSNGNTVQLSKLLNNGAVILDFWASWCVPCKKELPELAKIGEKYDSLTVVAVTIDKPKDRIKAQAAIKTIKGEIVYLFDENDMVKNLFEVKDVPTTILIDKTGVIRFRHVGYNTGEESAIDTEAGKFLKPVQVGGGAQ
jgi:thiol-disulfide isomerase/thioredoxin